MRTISPTATIFTSDGTHDTISLVAATQSKRARRRQMEALRDHICQHRPTTSAAIAKPLQPSTRTERPISFNDEMIRALLTGRKNQTRRLARGEERCPFGAPGDVLWV